jgi:hypothetical protein
MKDWKNVHEAPDPQLLLRSTESTPDRVTKDKGGEMSKRLSREAYEGAVIATC